MPCGDDCKATATKCDEKCQCTAGDCKCSTDKQHHHHHEHHEHGGDKEQCAKEGHCHGDAQKH